MRRRVIILLCILALVATTAAAIQYKITVSSGIDTPDRDISLEGSTFTVRGIAAVDPGDPITATIATPDSDGFRVYVYGTVDGSRELMDSKYVDGASSVTFDTSGYQPGTYTFALHADGDYRAVYPFIVTGAQTAITAPGEAMIGDTITLRATPQPTHESVTVTDVEFVVYSTDTTRRLDAVADGDGSYTATLETGDLAAGDYTVYAIIQNDSQSSLGEPEAIALSTLHTLTLTDQSDDSTPHSPTSTTTTTRTSSSNPAQSTTPSSTPTTSTTATTPQDTTPPSTTTTTLPSTTPPSTTSPTSSTTTDNVLTPNTETTPAPTPSIPPTLTIAALLAAIALATRQ